MSEVATLDLDPELLALASDLDQIDIPESDEEAPMGDAHHDDSPLFEDSEEEKIAESALDGFETTIQVFFNERYAIGEAKKGLAIAAYGKLLKKHEGAAPSWLGKYKEEIICLVITLFLFAGTFRAVKVLNEEDRQQAERDAEQQAALANQEAQGEDDGEESQ